MTRTLSSLVLICALALSACGGEGARSGPSAGGSALLPEIVSGNLTGSPIKHVIIMIQENRSFDNLFAHYGHGADGASEGKCVYLGTTKTHVYRLVKSHLIAPVAGNYAWGNFTHDVDGGKMDGFCNAIASGYGKVPYEYVDPTEIAPYWSIAQQYVLGDRMFSTMGSGSLEAHQDLIRGDTVWKTNPSESIVDNPAPPWGCDSARGEKTSLLRYDGTYLRQQGPYPCFRWKTLRDLLDAKGVSWKYYSPITMVAGSNGGIWNAFLAIDQVYHGREWTTNVTNSPPYEMQIFTDIKNGKLPAVSWLIPDAYNSDHAGETQDYGPSWVASVVNAVGQSPYWNDTAVVVVWDDWGGWYDHVVPPKFNYYGGGIRVPCLIVSAYSRKGYVDHTTWAFGSILRYVEDTFALGRLGTTDTTSTSIRDAFDYGRPPRTFVPIASAKSKDFFLHQAPSMHAVDTQ